MTVIYWLHLEWKRRNRYICNATARVESDSIHMRSNLTITRMRNLATLYMYIHVVPTMLHCYCVYDHIHLLLC